ncbi:MULTISPECIES: histone [Candidatus Protochlamydia]|nr:MULTISPECIES: histone [Protochlamydia]
MSLKDTFKNLRELLSNITSDLEKSENGNKAASQRVRTGTVKLEKIAKLFRKESIASEKKTKGQKKPAKTAPKAAKAPAKKAAAPAKKAAAPAKKAAAVKAKPKAKSTSFRPRQMSVKRATAKIPTRKTSA